jgi:hypothetical protein
VAYISPNFGGATIIAAYQNGTPAADGVTVKKESRAYTVGVTYAGGPVFVGAGYINAKQPSVGATVAAGALDVAATAGGLNAAVPGLGTDLVTNNDYNDKLTNFRLAAVVSLASGTSISALYDSQKYELSASSLSTDAKRGALMFGVKQAFGANAVYGQYAMTRDIKGGICGAIDCTTTGMKQFTLGFIHEMSKRTMVHAFYTKLTNEEEVGYDHYVNAVGNSEGADSTVIGLGLRHAF